MVLLSDDDDKLHSESNILSNCMINSQSWFNIQVETYTQNVQRLHNGFPRYIRGPDTRRLNARYLHKGMYH